MKYAVYQLVGNEKRFISFFSHNGVQYFASMSEICQPSEVAIFMNDGTMEQQVYCNRAISSPSAEGLCKEIDQFLRELEEDL